MAVLGALIGYMIIIGDIAIPFLEHEIGTGTVWTNRAFVIFMFALLVAFPLSNFRTIS